MSQSTGSSCCCGGTGASSSDSPLKFSGTLVAVDAPLTEYSGDTPGGMAGTPVQYPILDGSVQLRLAVSVTENTMGTTTDFTIFRGGVTTGQKVQVLAGVTGVSAITTLNVGFAAGDTIDLAVTSPGGALEVGHRIAFSALIAFV